LPKQNRPVVRDGRLQSRKKRTDRSYLTPAGRGPAPAPPADEPAQLDEAPPQETAGASDQTVVAGPQPPAPVAEPPVRTTTRPAAPTPPPVASRPSATARALQQQGVRKRREFDVTALARRDTQYALHELRRIAILATLVIVTLIVLGIVLR
jgi:hypothetical protein